MKLLLNTRLYVGECCAYVASIDGDDKYSWCL